MHFNLGILDQTVVSDTQLQNDAEEKLHRLRRRASVAFRYLEACELPESQTAPYPRSSMRIRYMYCNWWWQDYRHPDKSLEHCNPIRARDRSSDDQSRIFENEQGYVTCNSAEGPGKKFKISNQINIRATNETTHYNLHIHPGTRTGSSISSSGSPTPGALVQEKRISCGRRAHETRPRNPG